MKKAIYIFFLLYITSLEVYSQDMNTKSPIEYFIMVNCNVYVPINNPYKGVFPIVGYDKTVDPKVLIGGFGVGLTALKSFQNKLRIKGEFNVSKHNYWDETVGLRTISNQPMGDFVSSNADFTLEATTIFHYSLSKKLSIGTGLGAHVLLVSLSRFQYESQTADGSIYTNKYYKTVMPVIPLELSLKTKKMLFNIRYEYGMLNRLCGDLAKEKTDKYSVLNFEVGFKIN